MPEKSQQTYSKIYILIFTTAFIINIDQGVLPADTNGIKADLNVFPCVCFPVWVDLYGNNYKTVWLAILQIAVPLGIFAGYTLTAILSSFTTWRWAFWIQIMLLGLCILIFLFIPEYKLDTNNNLLLEQYQSSISSSEGTVPFLMKANQSSFPRIRTSSLYMHLDFNENYEEDEKQFFDNPVQIDYISPTINNNNIFNKESERESIKKNYFQLLKMLMKNKLYICAMLTISTLYFIVTGIQFWISDYFVNVMKQEKKTVSLVFSFISITAPTLGVVFGGFIIQKYGGYISEKALFICNIFGFLAFSVAAPVPFIDIFGVVAILLWFLLFFGGALMTPITGYKFDKQNRRKGSDSRKTSEVVVNKNQRNFVNMKGSLRTIKEVSNSGLEKTVQQSFFDRNSGAEVDDFVLSKNKQHKIEKRGKDINSYFKNNENDTFVICDDNKILYEKESNSEEENALSIKKKHSL